MAVLPKDKRDSEGSLNDLFRICLPNRHGFKQAWVQLVPILEILRYDSVRDSNQNLTIQWRMILSAEPVGRVLGVLKPLAWRMATVSNVTEANM